VYPRAGLMTKDLEYAICYSFTSTTSGSALRRLPVRLISEGSNSTVPGRGLLRALRVS